MYQPINNLTFTIALYLAGVPLLRSKNKFIHGSYYIWIVFWSADTLNMIVLFSTNLLKGNYSELPDDFAFFVAHFLAFLGSLFFAIHYEKWQTLFELLSTHGPFGPPPRFHRVEIIAAVMGKAGLIYLTSGTLTFVVIMLLDEEKCDKLYKGEKVCGMLNPTWWPQQIAITVLRKRIVLVYQVLSVYYMGCILYVCFMVFQAVVHIGHRADHLSDLFENHIFTNFQTLKDWIEYHEETIRLCCGLNRVFKRTVGHVSLIVAVTIASHGYQVVRDRNAKGLFYVLAYLILIFLLCYSGQRMEDKMIQIGNGVYFSEWYNYDPVIQNLIMLIILRTQRRVVLHALPIGHTNHLLLLTVAKATYSYLTLLQKTM